MKTLKIFIIVVNYNSSRWLDKCYSSLLNSTLDISIIVIDNLSSDGSFDKLCKCYPQFTLIQNNKNIGFGNANNIGIQKAFKAGADYVFLLNQDAWIEPDTIEKLVEAAKKNPGYGILSPLHFNGNGSKLDFRFSNYIIPEKCPNLYSDLITGNLKEIYKVSFVNAAAWLLTRKCIEKVGLFEPEFFLYGEDLNYIQRAKFHKMQIGVVPNTKIYHDREERKGKLNIKSYSHLKRSDTLAILLDAERKFYINIFFLYRHYIFNSIKNIMKPKRFLIDLKEMFMVLFHIFKFYNIYRSY